MSLHFRHRTLKPDEIVTKSDLIELSHRYSIHYKVLCEIFRLQRKAFKLSNVSYFSRDTIGVALLDGLLNGLFAFARGCQGFEDLKYHFQRFQALSNLDMAVFIDKVNTYQNKL
jgi:hypothetical protein